MSRSRKEIYRRRNPWKVLLAVVGIAVAAFLVLAITIFFWFQRYAVYTDQGVTLDVPWLEEYRNQE